MEPALPTPQEVAQWVLEAHARNILGDLPNDQHAAVLGHLAAVYDEMDPQALKAALGAMTDIAEELMAQLVVSTRGRDNPTDLILRGNGRLHVVSPLPSNLNLVGAVPAKRLASRLGFTAIWGCRRDDFDDYSLDNYDEDLYLCEQALARRAHSQVALMETFLQGLASDLTIRAQAPSEGCSFSQTRHHQHNSAVGCRLEIAELQGTIARRSRELFDETGTMETAEAIHRRLFPEEY